MACASVIVVLLWCYCAIAVIAELPVYIFCLCLMANAVETIPITLYFGFEVSIIGENFCLSSGS